MAYILGHKGPRLCALAYNRGCRPLWISTSEPVAVPHLRRPCVPDELTPVHADLKFCFGAATRATTICASGFSAKNFPQVRVRRGSGRPDGRWTSSQPKRAQSSTLTKVMVFASASVDARAGTGSLWFGKTKATTSPRTMETLSRECPLSSCPTSHPWGSREKICQETCRFYAAT